MAVSNRKEGTDELVILKADEDIIHLPSVKNALETKKISFDNPKKFDEVLSNYKSLNFTANIENPKGDMEVSINTIGEEIKKMLEVSSSLYIA
ncbi:hypothetical protein [Helicobacter sp.]|uniref:hypothetical protein n=1 Tax=Helicobacter sp. TaxID=218 RepID=UPI002A913647|nr:hypothetical protein [Helicobacter sp.]MDY5557775.1 hypothetical protein [Helicobacter sp.]